jgi:protein SCO1/2
MSVYLGAFSKDFIGARGDEAQLAPLLKSLSAIAAQEKLPDGGYTMDHSATLYLLDTQARLAAVFSPPFKTADLTTDLHRIATDATL